MCSIEIPEGKHVIITGPDPHSIEIGVGAQQAAVIHEEADVIMAYHVIKGADNVHSLIKVVSANTDVLIILSTIYIYIPTTLHIQLRWSWSHVLKAVHQ